MDNNSKINGLQFVYDKINKSLKELEIKINKEQEKLDQKYITFKGCPCKTYEDIDEIYGCGNCTNTEREKAYKRLDKKLNTNSNTLDSYNYAKKILENQQYSVGCELYDLRQQERKKEGFKRFKETMLQYDNFSEAELIRMYEAELLVEQDL